MPVREEGDQRNRCRVSVRTILKLGGELIRSDGIAFYTLIKNDVDAGSKKVHVDVQTQLLLKGIQKLRAIAEGSDTIRKSDLKRLKAEAASAVVADAPDGDALCEAIAGAGTLNALLDTALDANAITFRDTRSGMTPDDVETIYLTFGTLHWLDERKSGVQRGILLYGRQTDQAFMKIGDVIARGGMLFRGRKAAHSVLVLRRTAFFYFTEEMKKRADQIAQADSVDARLKTGLPTAAAAFGAAMGGMKLPTELASGQPKAIQLVDRSGREQQI
jgi:hypothetical protein